MFHLIPPNIGQARVRGPSSRLGRRVRATGIVGAAAIALLASAHTIASAEENWSPIAREHHACAVVMGLHQPGDLYDTCVRSLHKTLSELHRARLAKNERSACIQSGFTPGTRAFAVCEVTAEQ